MKIFISYRRADSKYVVDRIRDHLIHAYGEEAIFRDLESIPLGQDFSSVLNEATASCDVMLVVIGPQWAGITDAQGNKRLFDPQDYTRREVEAGLANQKIPVIPLLVMNASMPGPDEIPESLRSLRLRNAINIRNDPDFNPDMQRLIQGINEQVPSAAKSRSQPKKERKPMDPATLATAATSLLLPFLSKVGEKALDKIAEQLPEKVGAVWSAISNRFKGNPAASGAAVVLAENADDNDNQEAFVLQLRSMLKKDQDFAGLLTDLVEEAKSDPSLNRGGDNVTANNNSVAVGRISVGGSVNGNFVIGNNNRVTGK